MNKHVTISPNEAADRLAIRELVEAYTHSLAEVTLVSRQAVRALTLAERHGIELRNCPAYVHEWVSRAKESHD
jgi:hypothetical protein